MLENIKAVQKTLQTTAVIISKIMASGEFENNNDAFVVLRASLKALRDRLEPGESVHLGSQLPALLRGFYFEGWDRTGTQSKSRNKEQFLDEVRFHLNGHDNLNLESAVPIVMKEILDSIDQGEAVQVLHNIPKEIRDLCP